jgi:hypothetical protein
MSICITRGDIASFLVTATKDGSAYKFKAGDVVRIKVFGKKDCTNVVLQKDFPVESVADSVEISLTESETRIGETISKPKDYWYEVELNPNDNPQTIVGYDEDGPKVFKLFPEGKDLEDDPIEPEDIPIVDSVLDTTSTRPIQNQAVAKEFLVVKGQITNHENRKDNPHGVTIAQIGAAPASHITNKSNPHGVTAAQVGATPASHATDKNNPHGVTIAQIGAAPASHVTDKNNPHGVTLAQIGAAPASGFEAYYSVSTDAELNTKIAELTEAQPAKTEKTYEFNLTYTAGNNLPSGFMSVTIHKYGASNAAVTAVSFLNRILYLHRELYNGTWLEWEWENPPMVPGVEYRTTERYNGKPVYIKEISCGSVSATGITRIPCEISWGNVVDYNVLYTKQGVAHKDTLYKDGSNVSFVFWEYSNICIFSGNNDVSNYKVYVTVKYMKD